MTVDLLFEAGVQRSCFDIFTISDSIPEEVETFRVNIISSSDTRVVITAPETVLIEIIDEDSE